MTETDVINLVAQALEVMAWLGAPLLLVALFSGLLVGVLQAATQINEVTLSFIPKMLAIMAAVMVFGPWMLRLIIDYTQRLFAEIPGLIG